MLESIGDLVVVAGGSDYCIVNATSKTIMSNGSISQGSIHVDYGASATDNITTAYFIVSEAGSNNPIILMYNTTTNEWSKLTALSSSRPVGMAYMSSGSLAILYEGGPLVTLSPPSYTETADTAALPFNPQGSGDRLEYVHGKIMFLRGENTSQVWYR